MTNKETETMRLIREGDEYVVFDEKTKDMRRFDSEDEARHFIDRASKPRPRVNGYALFVAFKRKLNAQVMEGRSSNG